MPVVFWATLDFQPVPEKRDHWLLADGTDFAWKCNEHCLLLVGYDDENYWFNDPWHDHASARSRNSWWRTATRPKGCSPSPSARKEKYEKRRISAEHERQDAAVRGRRSPAPEKGSERHRPCDLQPFRAGAAAHAVAGRCAVERVPMVRRTAASLLRRQCGHVGLHGGLHPQQRDGQQCQDHMDGHHRHPAGRGRTAVFLRQEQHRPQRPEKAGDPPH